MRGSKAILAVALAATLALPTMASCAKSASTKGASQAIAQDGCTAHSGRSAASLQVSSQGSSPNNPTITVLVGNTTGFKVGKVTLSFLSWAPPAAINGPISAPVQDGRAVLRLNPRLQRWVAPSGAVPLIVRATGEDDAGKEASAECPVKARLAKFLKRVLDCLTKSGSTLYTVAITFFGSAEESWTYSVPTGGVNVYTAPTRSNARSYTQRNPRVSLTQTRTVNGTEVTENVELGVQYGPFGPDDEFNLRVVGPHGQSCTVEHVSPRSRS